MVLFRVPLRTREWIGLSVINTMYNYFLPFQGAMLLRAQYLKRKYGFEYSKYAALAGGSLLIGLLLSGLISIVLLLVKYVLTGFLYKNLLILVCILFVITVALAVFFWNIGSSGIRTRWSWFDRLISKILTAVSFFKKDNHILAVITLSTLALYFFSGLRLYFSFQALGISIGLLEILIVQSISVFSMILPITPGSLGVREGIIGLVCMMLHVNIEDAILAAALDRVAGIVTTFSLGTVYHFILIKDLKNIERIIT